MAGLDSLLQFLSKAANVAPSYTASRCIAVTRSKAACHACLDACPHDAVRIERAVTIDEVDCTGCGLCVQACPSEALEPKVGYQAGASVRCSQVKGDAQSVLCLGRLQATDLLRLGARQGELTLAHGDCSTCTIGTPQVLREMQRVREEARALAAQHGKELVVRFEQRERFDADHAPQALSRRQLLTGGLNSARKAAADALAPLEGVLRMEPEPGERSAPPRELTRRFHAIRLAEPEPEARVPWRLPRVGDGCILCPVCTRVCPTDAFSRDFDPPGGGGTALRLDPERCVGCDACVDACPVKVIEMDDLVTWRELSGGTQTAYQHDPAAGREGSVAR